MGVQMARSTQARVQPIQTSGASQITMAISLATVRIENLRRERVSRERNVVPHR
jgi:hypothetical protein